MWSLQTFYKNIFWSFFFACGKEMRLSVRLVNPGNSPATIFYILFEDGETSAWKLLQTKDCRVQAFLLSKSCRQTPV
uniref:Uncharacterized protein n=1 Tax=Marseillevirus sp. TaxID=2809551 RepID=A0AA96EPR6_9VIRU|nr:hypothetical protein MarDSR_042 [Marseillevirus sp.]